MTFNLLYLQEKGNKKLSTLYQPAVGFAITVSHKHTCLLRAFQLLQAVSYGQKGVLMQHKDKHDLNYIYIA